ncbi:MAG: alanine racemase [Burkholderiaceae bacterium]
MSRPLLALIDPFAMHHNLMQAKALAPAARVWAVIKANAYGHGLQAATQGLNMADGFALLEFDKALALREADPQRRLLMLEGAFDAPDTELAARHGLELVVHDESQLRWIEALDGPRRLAVWLKFNNGMNRLGFARGHFRQAFERLVGLLAVARISLMTHFANADAEHGCDDPLARFEQAAKGLPGDRSLANSAATVQLPAAHGQWIRPGIMLYGATPIAERSAAHLGLRAAMHLQSRLIAVQNLLPGESVGYGSTFVAGRPMRVGVVACGYADGYPRSAGTGTPVMVDGHRTRLVGRVSMDMLTVDLDPVPQAGVGSPVQLWGDQVAIDEIAAAAGTIGYEVMCRLAPRVPVQVLEAQPAGDAR